MAAVTDVRIQQPSVSHAVWVTGKQSSWRLVGCCVFSLVIQMGRLLYTTHESWMGSVVQKRLIDYYILSFILQLGLLSSSV